MMGTPRIYAKLDIASAFDWKSIWDNKLRALIPFLASEIRVKQNWLFLDRPAMQKIDEIRFVRQAIGDDLMDEPGLFGKLKYFFRNRWAIPSHLDMIRRSKELVCEEDDGWEKIISGGGNDVFLKKEECNGDVWIVEVELRGTKIQYIHYKKRISIHFFRQKKSFFWIIAWYRLGSYVTHL